MFEHLFLHQRISVTVQRSDSFLLQGGFIDNHRSEQRALQTIFFS